MHHFRTCRRISVLLLLLVFCNCKNYRISQLESAVGTSLDNPQLVDSDEGMDEMTGDRYFVSKYLLSKSDKEKLLMNRTFTPLTNFSELEHTKLSPFLSEERKYLIRSAVDDKEVIYIILAEDNPILIFAYAQFSAPNKRFP